MSVWMLIRQINTFSAVRCLASIGEVNELWLRLFKIYSESFYHLLIAVERFHSFHGWLFAEGAGWTIRAINILDDNTDPSSGRLITLSLRRGLHLHGGPRMNIWISTVLRRSFKDRCRIHHRLLPGAIHDFLVVCSQGTRIVMFHFWWFEINCQLLLRFVD